jgi:hypothetical protein
VGTLRDTIYTSVLSAFGKREHLNTDWYEAHSAYMQPIKEAKKEALLAYKETPAQAGATYSVLHETRPNRQPVNV